VASISVGAIKGAIELNSQMGKLARTVGLTAEAFQEYQFAAQRAGIAESLFTSSMTAFVKRVGEAQVGMGPLVSGLKNLNAELLNNITGAKNQEEAFGILADAIKNASSATEAAAIANAAFGRSGIKMVEMLRGGASGLREMQAEAQRLGLVMNDDLVEAAEALDNSIGDFTKKMQVAFSTVILSAAVNVQTFATDLMTLVENSEIVQAALIGTAAVITVKMIPAIVALTLRLKALALSNPFTALALAATVLIANWRAVKDFFEKEFQLGLLAVVKRVTEAWRGFIDLVNIRGIFDDNLAKLDAQIGVLGKAMELAAADVVGLNTELAHTQELAADIQVPDIVTNMPQQASDAERALAAYNKSLDQHAERVKSAFDPYHDFGKEMDILNALLETGRITWEQYADATFAAQDALDGVAKSTAETAQEATTTLGEIKDAIDGFSRDFTNNLVDSLAEGKLAFDDFGKSVLKTIAKIVLNKQFESLFSMISGGFEGFFSGGGGISGSPGPTGIAGAAGPQGQAGALNGPIGTSNPFTSMLAGPSGGVGIAGFRRTMGVGGGGYGAPNINVYNNDAGNADVEVSTRNNGADIDIIIERKVNSILSSGRADKAMAGRYSARPRGY
jgi:hypothetical protein